MFHFPFMLWRPITAIRLANTDGNDATDVLATCMPLTTTPPYPDTTRDIRASVARHKPS